MRKDKRHFKPVFYSLTLERAVGFYTTVPVQRQKGSLPHSAIASLFPKKERKKKKSTQI